MIFNWCQLDCLFSSQSSGTKLVLARSWPCRENLPATRRPSPDGEPARGYLHKKFYLPSLNHFAFLSQKTPPFHGITVLLGLKIPSRTVVSQGVICKKEIVSELRSGHLLRYFRIKQFSKMRKLGRGGGLGKGIWPLPLLSSFPFSSLDHFLNTPISILWGSSARKQHTLVINLSLQKELYLPLDRQGLRISPHPNGAVIYGRRGSHPGPTHDRVPNGASCGQFAKTIPSSLRVSSTFKRAC